MIIQRCIYFIYTYTVDTISHVPRSVSFVCLKECRENSTEVWKYFRKYVYVYVYTYVYNPGLISYFRTFYVIGSTSVLPEVLPEVLSYLRRYFRNKGTVQYCSTLFRTEVRKYFRNYFRCTEVRKYIRKYTRKY